MNEHKGGPARIKSVQGSPVELELTETEVKGRAVRGVAGLLTRQIIVRMIGFAGMLVLARLLTPEMFGVFAITQFVIIFFEQVSGLGLHAALLRKKAPPTELELRTVFTIQQLVVVVAVGIVFLLAPFIVEHYSWDPSRAALIQVMAVALVLASWKAMPSLLLQHRLRHDLIAASDVVEHFVYQLTAITLAVMGYDVWSLVLAVLARGVVGVIVLHLFSSWRPAFGYDSATARDILRFGIPLQLAGLAGLANSAAVPVVVGTFLGASAVGYANLARSLLDALVYQPIIILGVVQFRVFGYLQDKQPRLVAAAERSLYLGSVLTFCIAAMLIVFAQPLVDYVLTEKWAPIIPLLYILGPAYFIYAVSQPQMQVLKSLGDSLSTLMAVVIMAIVQLGLLVTTINLLGLTSYALSAAVGIIAAGSYIQLRVSAQLPLRVVRNIIHPFVAALVGGASGYAAQHFADGLMSSILSLGLGMASYVLVLGILSGRRLQREIHDIMVTFRSHGSGRAHAPVPAVPQRNG